MWSVAFCLISCELYLIFHTLYSPFQFTRLGKPRQHLPAPSLKPAIKASQDAFLLSCSHSLTSCLSNGLTALRRLGASTHATVVLAPTVSQCLGLAGFSSAPCICSAFDLLTHSVFLQICLGIGRSIKGRPLLIFSDRQVANTGSLAGECGGVSPWCKRFKPLHPLFS